MLYPLRFKEILRNYRFGNRWITTEFAKQGGLAGEDMIRPEDLSSAVLWLLQLSPNVRIPEIIFERVGDDLF